MEIIVAFIVPVVMLGILLVGYLTHKEN